LLKTIFTENEKQIKSKNGTTIFEHACKKITHLFGYEVKKLEKNKLTYYYLSNTLETPKIYSDYEIARESFLMIVLGLINTTKEKKISNKELFKCLSKLGFIENQKTSSFE